MWLAVWQCARQPFCSVMVEISPSVVYNDYCKILRTDRRLRLKVLNFYGGSGIGKMSEHAMWTDEMLLSDHVVERLRSVCIC
jgi:hypothetical protein